MLLCINLRYWFTWREWECTCLIWSVWSQGDHQPRGDHCVLMGWSEVTTNGPWPQLHLMLHFMRICNAKNQQQQHCALHWHTARQGLSISRGWWTWPPPAPFSPSLSLRSLERTILQKKIHFTPAAHHKTLSRTYLKMITELKYDRWILTVSLGSGKYLNFTSHG